MTLYCLKIKLISTILAAAAVIVAQHDNTAPLTKPPLANNLDYLENGLQTLPQTTYTLSQWTNGQIPQDCYDIAHTEGRNPTDFLVYAVTYTDCVDPWYFCYHKNTEITIDSMAYQWGKLPIQMRQWVKHVVTMPAPTGQAYALNGNTVFFHPNDHLQTEITHETGHLLDGLGAYGYFMSTSDNWWNNYNLDSNVPDPYSQTDSSEDVAQNTVVALFNNNIFGGFGTVEPNYSKVIHQYMTLLTAAADSGQDTSLFSPGQNLQCRIRLPNSPSVIASNGATPSPIQGDVEDTSLKQCVPIVPINQNFTTKGSCKLAWE
ncbi:MAG: hypothetical protein M1820_004458 [Bogoriella megaspora]|nr:MAG: hypothetical protein M1820_004458 [Bogoriella megaspora]